VRGTVTAALPPGPLFKEGAKASHGGLSYPVWTDVSRLSLPVANEGTVLQEQMCTPCREL
jgi:hypothetical protein